MGRVFTRKDAEKIEAWYSSRPGREVFRLQKELTLNLLKPEPGWRLLEVGSGTGRLLQFFRREGLAVTGIDPSPEMLELAARRLGGRIDLHQGRAEDLPFEDDEFDVVILITSLEFIDDPLAALAEAFRTARRKVFIGVLNSLSLTALGRRLQGLFSPTSYSEARFYNLWRLSGMIRSTAGPCRIDWASAGLLPLFLSWRAPGFEASPLVRKSPFGAFLGLSATVSPTWRTKNLIADEERLIRGRAAPEPTPAGFGSSTVSRAAARSGSAAWEVTQ